MVKFFLAFFLISFCTLTKGQNITLDQAISLRKKSLASVEEFLTAKNWEMIEATEKKEDKYGCIKFAYNKKAYDDKAESFIGFFYDTPLPDNYSSLQIQLSKIKTYNIYVARMKELGYKLEKSFIEEGSVVKVYKKNETIIVIRVSNQKEYSETKTIYTFFICHPLIYALQYYGR